MTIFLREETRVCSRSGNYYGVYRSSDHIRNRDVLNKLLVVSVKPFALH